MSKILYKDLSYKVQGAIMAVRRKYGPGLPERFYHRALSKEFDRLGIFYQSKPRICLYTTDPVEDAGYMEPDFLVEGKIIIEIKVKPFTPKALEVQLFEYLKNSLYQLGYLVNFGTPRLDMRRRIYTNDRKPFLNIQTN